MILDINLSQTPWLFCTRYNITEPHLEYPLLAEKGMEEHFTGLPLGIKKQESCFQSKLSRASSLIVITATGYFSSFKYLECLRRWKYQSLKKSAENLAGFSSCLFEGGRWAGSHPLAGPPTWPLLGAPVPWRPCRGHLSNTALLTVPSWVHLPGCVREASYSWNWPPGVSFVFYSLAFKIQVGSVMISKTVIRCCSIRWGMFSYPSFKGWP